MNRVQKIIFILILLLSAFLLFFNLTRHDVIGDDATYAFRSIGYFDYMASEKQTTPVQWFSGRPWWSYLSFHDHPPLYFLIHYIFFKILGVSVFVARLPSALAALGTIIITFFIGRKLAGNTAGLIAASALAMNSYFIWTGRVGLLESLFLFWAMLGIWFFLKAFEDEKKFLWAWAVFGLAFLTKYTLLFIIPAVFVYLFWRKREALRSRWFWRGVLLFLLVISPVIIFNIFLLTSRGHFDVQFDRLWPQDHVDWSILDTGNAQRNFSLQQVLATYAQGVSYVYATVALLATSLAGYWIYRKKITEAVGFLVLILVFLAIAFSLYGAEVRFLGILGPFLALIIGIVIARFRIRTITLPALVVLAAYFSIFTFNSNNSADGSMGSFWQSPHRIGNQGYNQLDKKVDDLLENANPTPETENMVYQWWYSPIDPAAVAFGGGKTSQSQSNPIIIYDSNMSWFPSLWTFERYKFYDKFLIMTTAQFWKAVTYADPAILDNIGLTDIYFIKASDSITEKQEVRYSETELVLANFENDGIEPEIIRDGSGKEAFYIYHRKLK